MAMLTGTHPFCSKTVTCLPSPSTRPAFHRVNRREIAGLVGIADTPKFLKHHENFKNTKTSKTPLGPREKLLGRAGLVL
jgi:hypothetical protein